MSLVAYESSDESDDEVPSQSKAKTTVGTSERLVIREESDEAEKPVSKRGLFSSLPAPKCGSEQSLIVVEGPVHRVANKKESVKIMIPSLKEFKDEEEKEEKSKINRKASKVSSGLIGLLPEPQNLNLKESAKALIPLSVSRKKAAESKATTRKDCLPEMSGRNGQAVAKVTNSDAHLKPEQDHGSDDETLTDFFSLSESPAPEVPGARSEESSVCVPSVPVVGTSESVSVGGENASGIKSSRVPSGSYSPSIDHCNVNSSASASTYFDTQTAQYYGYECTDSQQQQHEWNDGPSAEFEQPTLRNEALVRLAGKKRSSQESIEFVDVNGDDLVAGRDEWLLKSLSETNSYQPVPKRSDQPSAMHRRKHQITYLAFQAKAREQELKNQWSMNRMTKKQTQSKYGF